MELNIPTRPFINELWRNGKLEHEALDNMRLDNSAGFSPGLILDDNEHN